MAARRVSRTTLIAILVSSAAALIAKAWLQTELISRGVATQTAADVAYLMVPLVLMALLFPLWCEERQFLCRQFRHLDLTVALVWRALAIGVLLRLLWWCQLVVGISFGFYTSAGTTAIAGPAFSFQCGSLRSIGLSVLVMMLIVPLIEEVIHRGYVQTAVARYGAVIAVLVSAMVFAALHRPSGMTFALFAGVVFGTQYWRSRSLWPSLISHATVNGLILIDWRCLSGQWNPGTEHIPLMVPGVSATILALVFCGCLFVLISGTVTGASPPR